MGKSTISMAIFNSKLLVYQRVPYLTIKHEMKKHHELGLCHEHPRRYQSARLRGQPLCSSHRKLVKACEKHHAVGFQLASRRFQPWETSGWCIHGWLPSGDAPDTVLNSFLPSGAEIHNEFTGWSALVSWQKKVGIRHGRPSTNGDWTCKILGLVICYIAIENDPVDIVNFPS